MFKRKLTTGDAFLIIVNLIPLYGVWFEGWDAKIIFLVYCLETVIVGLVNILKMACVTLFIRPTDEWENGGAISMQSGWFFIFFFALHYGFFVFIQTQVFFSFSDVQHLHTGQNIYRQIPGMLGSEGKLLLGIFVLYYTLQAFFSFFSTGEYKRISLARLMFQPYTRIFVQQVIVIFGSMFLTFGADKIFILIVVAVKIIAGLYGDLDAVLQKAEAKRKAEKIQKQ